MKRTLDGSKYRSFGRDPEIKLIKRIDYCKEYKKIYIDMLTHTKFVEDKDSAITLLMNTMMDMIVRMDAMAKRVKKLEKMNEYTSNR